MNIFILFLLFYFLLFILIVLFDFQFIFFSHNLFINTNLKLIFLNFIIHQFNLIFLN